MNQENEWARIDNTIGKDNREILNQKSVTMIGLGGLGCETSRLLAMTGIGKFRLIDKDLFEKQNVNRHPGMWEDIGKLKGAVARKIISSKNPNASVEAVTADARYQPEIFRGTDLVIISGLGSNSTQETIADNARRAGFPVLVSGVYDGGDAGEIFFIDPKSGPCYSCFTIASRQTRQNFEGMVDNPYGIPEDQIEAAVGLATDINQIAAIAAVSAKNILFKKPIFGEDDSVNMIIFANRKTQIPFMLPGGPVTIGPWESMPLILPKVEGCPNCTQSGNKILLSEIFNG